MLPFSKIAVIDGPSWWGSSLTTRAGSTVTQSTVKARGAEARAEARAVRERVAAFDDSTLVASSGSGGAGEIAMAEAGLLERPTLALYGIGDGRSAALAAVALSLVASGVRTRVFVFDVDPDSPRVNEWHALGLSVELLGPWEPPAEDDDPDGS